jgi:hypothetical protein
MAQEKIKLTKKLYDKQSAGNLIDRSFSEIMNSKDSMSNASLNKNLNKLFDLYNDLFYDIPKSGKQSHSTLFKQSRDYIGNYIDIKDEEIEALTNTITALHEEMAKESGSDPSHPFYNNGTIIVDREADWNIYYMDKATRRKLEGDTGSDLFRDLRAALGHRGNWEDSITYVSPSVISQIKPGPNFGPEDLGSGETNVGEELQSTDELLSAIRVNIMDNWKVKPANFALNKYKNYRNHLKTEIEQTWETEKQLDRLVSKYTNDVQYSFTDLEKEKAQFLLDSLAPQIRLAQERLTFYKRTWSDVSSSPTSNDTGKMQMAIDNFSGHLDLPVTDSERNEYRGWKSGKNNFPNIDLN